MTKKKKITKKKRIKKKIIKTPENDSKIVTFDVSFDALNVSLIEDQALKIYEKEVRRQLSIAIRDRAVEDAQQFLKDNDEVFKSKINKILKPMFNKLIKEKVEQIIFRRFDVTINKDPL